MRSSLYLRVPVISQWMLFLFTTAWFSYCGEGWASSQYSVSGYFLFLLDGASHQKPWLSLARYAFILTTLPRDSWLCYGLIGPVVEGEVVSIICGCNINKKTSPELSGLIQQHSYLADSFVGLMGGASGLGCSAFLCWSCSHFCDQQVVLWLYYSAVSW